MPEQEEKINPGDLVYVYPNYSSSSGFFLEDLIEGIGFVAGTKENISFVLIAKYGLLKINNNRISKIITK